MVKSTTAQDESNICPLCGETLANDHLEKGAVRHLARPRGDTIFDDATAIQRMLDNGDLSPDYRSYFERTGYCPFQHGQRD